MASSNCSELRVWGLMGKLEGLGWEDLGGVMALRSTGRGVCPRDLGGYHFACPQGTDSYHWTNSQHLCSTY